MAIMSFIPERRGLLALLGVLAMLDAAAAISVRDDLGQTITLARPAQRIISLAPSLTENVFAVGAGAQLVGAVDYSDYPPPARKIERVGGYHGFDLERIRALKPDLVLAWASGNPQRQVEQIKAMGIPVFVNEAKGLQDIPGLMVRLGQLSGHEAEAKKQADAYVRRLAALEQTYAARTPVRVFYQVWQRPLMTINREQFISDALRRCGAVNVFAGLASLTPTVDEEAVIAARPQAIITSGGEEGAPLAHWRKWRDIPAVRRGQLHVLPPDILVRMGPRLVDGAEALCKAVDQARRAG